MAYLLGVVLFALAIFVSVCLHEAGHMLTAKSFGMKVTRYFAGFGPTLWSFRKGETEYGLKALPLGGFVKIVGMTPQDDDVPPEDEPRAMWRQPLWKRTVVMSAGSITHFILAFVVLWITLTFVGVPNPAIDPTKQPAMITVADCVYPTEESQTCDNQPVSPSKQAGLQDGDVITALSGQAINTYDDLQKAIRNAPVGPVDITYQRGGQTMHTTATLVSAQRHPLTSSETEDTTKTVTVAALGVGWKIPATVPQTVTYGAGESLKQSGVYTGRVFAAMGSAIGQIPGKVPALWNSLSGKPRDPNTPISVVGASRLGGETVQHGAWWLFLNILITLNFFIGVFNLLPLLPLDGGHIAIAFFERARSWLYARLHRPDPGRVNYLKLMPVTYVVILIFGGFTVLTVAADILNPITLFGGK